MGSVPCELYGAMTGSQAQQIQRAWYSVIAVHQGWHGGIRSFACTVTMLAGHRMGASFCCWGGGGCPNNLRTDQDVTPEWSRAVQVAPVVDEMQAVGHRSSVSHANATRSVSDLSPQRTRVQVALLQRAAWGFESAAVSASARLAHWARTCSTARRRVRRRAKGGRGLQTARMRGRRREVGSWSPGSGLFSGISRVAPVGAGASSPVARNHNDGPPGSARCAPRDVDRRDDLTTARGPATASVKDEQPRAEVVGGLYAGGSPMHNACGLQNGWTAAAKRFGAKGCSASRGRCAACVGSVLHALYSAD